MEESNKIESNLRPVKLKGKMIYRCPFCQNKFDRKTRAMNHIRSVHLLLKKFCYNCEEDVSFVSYDRHLRVCVTQEKPREKPTKSNHIAASSTTPYNRTTRSTTQSKGSDIQRQQNSFFGGTNVNEVK